MELIITIILSVLGLWFGSLEWRLRMMHNKIQESVDKDDVVELINLKQEPAKVLQAELKEDIQRLEAKIDLLTQKLCKKN